MVSDDDYKRLAQFRHTVRRFLRFSESAAEKAGLTPQQHQALLAVRGSDKERSSIGELAEQLQLRHHSAVGLVTRLEKSGLVERLSDPLDRRRVLVSLCLKGRAILEELTAAHREEVRRLGPELRKLLEGLEL